MSKPEDSIKDPILSGKDTSEPQGKDSESPASNPSHNTPESEKEEDFDDLEDVQTVKKVIAVSAVIMVIALIAYFLRDKIKAFVDKQRKKLDDKEREGLK